MFNSIRIKNFRGIRSAEIKGFQRINVFFGKNNCGKSTVLEALFLITGQSNPTLPLSINSIRNYTRFTESDLNLEFYGLNSENRISISVNGDENRWLEISLIKSNSNTVKLEDIGSGTSDNAPRAYGYKLNYSIGSEENQFSSEFVVKENDPESGKITRDKRYKEKIFSQYITSSIDQDMLNEELAKIFENKKEHVILSALQEIDPTIQDIQLVGNEIFVDIGCSQRLPINMTGDGLRKMLTIIISIYRCRDGVLLIDEVDNGFHFSAMCVLWKVILKVAEENNVQIFASTHNIDSLKGLSEILSTEGFADSREEVCGYKLLRNNNGDLTALKYDYASFNYSINQELEIR